MRRRIALLADSHFHERTRFAECIRLHAWIADDVARRGVDAVLHAGDVFDATSTPAERAAFARWLVSIAEHAPVIIVRGNHDAVGDLPLFARLLTRYPIIVEEASGVHVVGGVAVGALAWPRRAALLAALGRPVSGEEAAEGAREALRCVLGGLGRSMSEHDAPRVLLAHAMVTGSVTSAGQPLVGCDMEIGLADLAITGAHLVGLGHIHKAQDWTHSGTPIVYPGSPRRTQFGEIEEKGYVLAEFTRDERTSRWACVSWEPVTTPATQMLLLEHAWAPGSRHAFDPELARGSEVRLRYEVDREDREAAAHDAHAMADRFRAAGAVLVRVEEIVRTTTRARVPAVAAARTVSDKLCALWAARGTASDQGRTWRLLGRLGEIEEEAA